MPFKIDYSQAQPVEGAPFSGVTAPELPELPEPPDDLPNFVPSADDIGRAGFEAGFAAGAAALGLSPSAGAAVGAWVYDNLPRAHGIEGITDPSGFAQDWQEAVRQLSAREAAAQSPADWTQLVRDVSWWLTILMAERVGIVYGRQQWAWDAGSRGGAGVWHAPRDYDPRKPGSGVNRYIFTDVRNDDRFASLKSPEWQAEAALVARQLQAILANAQRHAPRTPSPLAAFRPVAQLVFPQLSHSAELRARGALRAAHEVLSHVAAGDAAALQLVRKLHNESNTNVPAARAAALLSLALTTPARAWAYL
jgi:hypothetical protein